MSPFSRDVRGGRGGKLNLQFILLFKGGVLFVYVLGHGILQVKTTTPPFISTILPPPPPAPPSHSMIDAGGVVFTLL